MERIDPPEPLAGQAPGKNHSIRRIEAIATHTGAKSYLEIGVNRGWTFRGVHLDKKVAVDPNFRFNVAEFGRTNVEYHAITSDRYFTAHGVGQKFDIIFLDGLHTFQQTLRDFCNSLSCAHDRTVWLIDDVLPVDVYSAWPKQAEAIAFRKEAGGRGGAWHGDVYKVLFAIHDFFPMYDYVTLHGAGNPQAVVWKSARPDFVPLFNSMETIERLSYFDMLKHKDTLKMKREPEGLRMLFQSVPQGPISC